MPHSWRLFAWLERIAWKGPSSPNSLGQFRVSGIDLT